CPIMQCNLEWRKTMVRLSKQQRKRKVSPRKPKLPGHAPKKNSIKQFTKIHKNTIQGALEDRIFIPFIKGKERAHV
ncbi:MAG: hypothetical protein ACRCSV_00745, partial [Chlamydiales bacterium]